MSFLTPALSACKTHFALQGDNTQICHRSLGKGRRVFFLVSGCPELFGFIQLLPNNKAVQYFNLLDEEFSSNQQKIN